MTVRVVLGDQTGRIRTELAAGNVSNIEWRLNGAGTATVSIKRGSSAFRRELLEPGARIYIEFENGLPAWGGIVDLPRSWEHGVILVRAHTIERLLRFQITSRTRAFYGDVVGSIFNQILNEIDASIGITIGHVWFGGAAHYPRYHFRDVMWVINNSIRKMENCDYRFVPYLNGGRIVFRAELHELLGNDRRERVALVEGANVGKVLSFSEQGDIINRVVAVGSGATWAEREAVWGVEEASKRRFGLREAVMMPADVSQTVTLSRYVGNAIRNSAYPHSLAKLSVSDSAPAGFGDYDVGDIVRVILPSFGFDGFGYDAPMRVVARGFDPQSGKCEVVLDERFEYLPVIQGEDTTQPGGEEE